MIDGDGDRLAQVLSNLLSNARSHGHRSGSIDVCLSATAGHAILSVSNVADALGENDRAHPVCPFKAVSLEHHRNRDGMGLFIVERTSQLTAARSITRKLAGA